MMWDATTLLNERYRCNLCGCDYYEEDIPEHVHDNSFDSFVIQDKLTKEADGST